jgi:hypothetical protein
MCSTWGECSNDGSGIEERRFQGRVESFPKDRVGDWRVSGRTIHVSSATKIDESIRPVTIGALVRVDGVERRNKSIDASEITVLSDRAQSGTIQAFPVAVHQNPLEFAIAGSVSFAHRPFWLNPRLLHDIAVVQPRFAATLALLNKAGFVLNQKVQVYWTPVEIKSGEIGAFLDEDNHKEYFRTFNERARELNRRIRAGDLAAIIYEITLAEEDLNTRVISLRVIDPGNTPFTDVPYYKSLTIGLLHPVPGEAAQRSAGTLARWQIN